MSDRTAESVAKSLGRTPEVRVISVIEVTFLRGAGIAPDDPVRQVVAYFDAETGRHIVELDPWMKDS